jgi:hypothetical protein
MGLPVWMEGSTIPDDVICDDCGHAVNEHDTDGWCQENADNGGCDDPEHCAPATCPCIRALREPQ